MTEFEFYRLNPIIVRPQNLQGDLFQARHMTASGASRLYVVCLDQEKTVIIVDVVL